MEARVIHVPDVEDPTAPASLHSVVKGLGFRSQLSVPLLRDGQPIGVLSLLRRQPGPYSPAQIALVTTFADQAVIAIENARLFEAEQTRTAELQARTRELTESLEQQTATAEVLKVISRSALDVQKVLDALVESAARLCNAYDAAILQVFGDGLRLVAHHGPIPWSGPVGQLAIPLVRGRIAARAVIDRRTIHVAAALAEADEYPESHKNALQQGYRTTLAVPLVHTGDAIGVILVRRAEVHPFTERQIELVNTFADQAVIAIENSRLFEAEQASKRELQESLEYQTATSEVLSVISRSPNELQPVLDTILETAQQICQSDRAQFFLLENGAYHLAAHKGTDPEFVNFLRDNPISAEAGTPSPAGRAARERRTIHVPDVGADAEVARWHLERGAKGKSILAVPLIRDGLAIGVITLAQMSVRPFTGRQIELVKVFADQAVIAIENTRLFQQVQARTRELAKTVDDLEIASQHKNQFVANMSHELRTPLAAILGYAELIQEGFYEPQGPKSLDALTRIRSNGKHLLGLINTVLDIAKIESGQFTLNMAEYAIESVVETVRSATESLAQNKKLALT